MKILSFIGLLVLFANTSCGQNDAESKITSQDTVPHITGSVVRADFASKLPYQEQIITDLTKTLSDNQLKSLDSIWKNFYNDTKWGIATMVLDSGRISELDFNEFSQAIYDRWLISEKSKAVFVIISPSLKKARLFVGSSLRQILLSKDIESITSNIAHSFNRNNLFITIEDGQTEIIDKIKQNGG